MRTAGTAGASLLLTGATGFLGKVVLYELVRRADRLGIGRIQLLIRSTRRSNPEARWREEIESSPCFESLPRDWPQRIDVVGGDLCEAGAGIAPDRRARLAASLTHIVHCAASVQFDLPIAEAASANITSALQVIELARACPKLASLVSVSTAYVMPHPGRHASVAERLAPLPRPAREIYAEILEGRADEAALLEETGHPNTYTLTKCLAEHLLSERAGGLPLGFVRPSIISASLREPHPGWIDSPAAFALFIMSIASGRMRAVIADPSARLDVVPVDAVAERVVDAAFAPRDASTALPCIRHAVAGFERSPTLAQCRRGIEEYFRHNPVVGARGQNAAARVRYLGRDGLHYRLRHWLHHSRRRDARLVAGRIEQTNRVFSYFTRNTFRFESSVPLLDPGFEPRAYVETVCRGVARHLMDGDESAVSFAGNRHTPPRGDLHWVLTQPCGSASLRAAAYLVRKVLRRCTERVTFDLASLEAALAQIPEGTPRVIVPTHRSYLDFVLVAYLAFARSDLGLAIPQVAASDEYARIPLLGRLLPRLGAFYVRRGSRRQEKQLAAEVDARIRAGHTLELFIEGHRSRDRRCLPPRHGLLRSLQATGERIALLPLAISYERIPEERRFAAELHGASPDTPRLRDLLGWVRRCSRGEIALGNVHLAFGTPIALDLRSDVHQVGRALIEQLEACTSISTHALLAFLEAEREALEGIDLRWLTAAIERRGGRVIEGSAPVVALRGGVERCTRHALEPYFREDAARWLPHNPAVCCALGAHSAAASQRDGTAPERDDPRVPRLLRAIFAPVCRDFAATAAALGAPHAPLRIQEPRGALEASPDLWLPHAEAAFRELCGREILERREERVAWGPRAGEVAAFVADCLEGIGAAPAAASREA